MIWVDYIEIEDGFAGYVDARNARPLQTKNFYGDWRFELQAGIVVEEHVHETMSPNWMGYRQ